MAWLTFSKGMNVLRSRGIRAVFKRGFSEFRNFLAARREFKKKVTFSDLDQLVDYGFNVSGGIVRPIQIKTEIRRLLQIVHDIKPRRMMEIGTANGGTLFLFTRVVAPDADLISLDLPGGEFGGGYPKWKRPMYEAFALPDQTIHLIQADSHQRATLGQVQRLCGGEPLDFLLVDGDHTEAGAQQDVDFFSPLVRPGGVIAFHDIAPNQNDPDNKVRAVWERIKAQFPNSFEEIIHDPAQAWAGIGVVWK